MIPPRAFLSSFKDKVLGDLGGVEERSSVSWVYLDGVLIPATAFRSPSNNKARGDLGGVEDRRSVRGLPCLL